MKKKAFLQISGKSKTRKRHLLNMVLIGIRDKELTVTQRTNNFYLTTGSILHKLQLMESFYFGEPRLDWIKSVKLLI